MQARNIGAVISGIRRNAVLMRKDTCLSDRSDSPIWALRAGRISPPKRQFSETGF